jgi:hypothetical protein
MLLIQKVRGMPDWKMALFLATARLGTSENRKSESSPEPEEGEL